MQKIYRLILIILLSAFISKNLFPQNYNLKAEKIAAENGISNNLIYSIYQDSKGFLWFGTMFGLIRYDGINYKTFRYDPRDSNSISNDDIISIFEDKDENLWCGTYNGGLNKYDRTSGNFTRYINNKGNENSIRSNTVWDIKQDNDGVLWLATEGGGLNKLENGIFSAYRRDNSNNSIGSDFIRSLGLDKDGNIWAGTFQSGINKFDKKKNIFTNYKLEPNSDRKNINFPENNPVTSVFCDSEGDLWAISGSNGLYIYDKTSDKFINYRNDSGNSESNTFYIVNEDSPGVLLVGTQKGLFKFYKKNGEFEKIDYNPSEKNKNETILSFLKDRSGVIWVSSYLKGLFKIQYPPEKFKAFLQGTDVKSIFEDKTGKLWIGTKGNGLLISEDGGSSFIPFVDNPNNKNNSFRKNINSVTEDSKGNIWSGTDSGLYKINNNIVLEFYKNDSAKNSLSSNNVLKVFCDREGILWIGTDNGLNKFNETDKSFLHFQNLKTDTNSLSENTILSIYEDKNNELWVGTYFGLNKLNKEKKTFRHFIKNPDDPGSLSNNYVFSFCEDSNNNFWIGTGGGLNIFDRNTESFFPFTEGDGLPNDVIAGIEADQYGYLWISTFKGISKFSLKNKSFRNYDSENGMPGNMFNPGSYFKNHKNELLFGSMKGIITFKPDEIKESSFNLPAMFTSFINYGSKEKKEIDITSLKEIKLKYDENIFKIGFSSQDYTNPGKIKFAYLLEGFDPDWNYSQSRNEAMYTNLNPGEYTFKIKATNSDGIWIRNETSVKIIITPPFWKTWWFYLLLITAMSGLVLVIYNFRVKAKIKYLLELEKIKEKERELMREQASRDYHDELGHKLTRISLYSRRINKKLRPTANGLTEDLNSIVETSNSLQSGAKDLIWAMNPKEDTLYDFAVRLKDFGNELFENTGIIFTMGEIDEKFKDINLLMNIKRHMIYIFKEGMNNILKYSRCSEVKLYFHFIKSELEIILTDNGIGFDPDNCAKGYGLRNIYSRSKQIDAEIKISSEKQKGTSVTLKIHLEKLIPVIK